MKFARQRLGDIEPFHVVELLTRAKALEAAGHDVIHMEVGEPDFPTPPHIVAGAMAALRQNRLGYTPALGLPELREAIAAFYGQRYGLAIDPARIVVTAGASGALTLACACLAEPGSRWLLTDPGYPCNRNFVRAFEGIPVALPVTAATGFQPTADQIAAAWDTQTASVLLASPSNPTGTLLPEASLRDISATVRRLGGNLVVDEIYHGLTYGAPAMTALRDDPNAAHLWVVQSFSKYWQMTGWRLGWLVVPEQHLRSVEKLAQSLFIAPSSIAQQAAMAAFSDDTLALLEERRAVFQQRRDILLPMLADLGFGVPSPPEGAFYVYADASQLTGDSYGFALRLLDRAHVAITPGIDFGRVTPERFVRFAYTTESSRLVEACTRIAEFVGS